MTDKQLCHVCGKSGRFSTPHPSDRNRERWHCQEHPPEHVRRFGIAMTGVMAHAARRGRIARLKDSVPHRVVAQTRRCPVCLGNPDHSTCLEPDCKEPIVCRACGGKGKIPAAFPGVVLVKVIEDAA